MTSTRENAHEYRSATISSSATGPSASSAEGVAVKVDTSGILGGFVVKRPTSGGAGLSTSRGISAAGRLIALDAVLEPETSLVYVCSVLDLGDAVHTIKVQKVFVRPFTISTSADEDIEQTCK